MTELRFTKFRLSAALNVDLPIIGALPSDVYILKAADGLGPTQQNNIFLNGVYQGKNPADRQVVLRVGLNPDYGLSQTPSQLRSTLYTMLAPKYGLMPLFQLMNSGDVVAEVQGQVENIEIVPFSKDPEVQITFNTNSPYLFAPNELTIIPTTKAQFTIDNPGSASVGFELEVTLTNPMSSFSLQKIGGLHQEMLITHAFSAGDIITIDTRENQRGIFLNSGGGLSTLVGDLSSSSIWLELDQGLNEFDPSSSAFDWGTVTFTPQYSGV